MTVYLVTGERPYRGHLPGNTFEADLEPGAEDRAIRRGAIQTVHVDKPTLQPGSYTLPEGWPTQEEDSSDG